MIKSFVDIIAREASHSLEIWFAKTRKKLSHQRGSIVRKSDFDPVTGFCGIFFPVFLEHFSDFLSKFVCSIFPSVEYFSGFFSKNWVRIFLSFIFSILLFSVFFQIFSILPNSIFPEFLRIFSKLCIFFQIIQPKIKWGPFFFFFF